MKKTILLLIVNTLLAIPSLAVTFKAHETIQGQMILVPAEGLQVNSTESVLIQVGANNPPVVMKVPAGCSSLPVILETTNEKTTTVGIRKRKGSYVTVTNNQYLSVSTERGYKKSHDVSIPFVKLKGGVESKASDGFTVGDSHSKTVGGYTETEETDQQKDVQGRKYIYFPCSE